MAWVVGATCPAEWRRVDVGVVVGGVGGPGDSLRAAPAAETGHHEVGVQGVDGHPPVAEGRVGGVSDAVTGV